MSLSAHGLQLCGVQHSSERWVWGGGGGGVGVFCMCVVYMWCVSMCTVFKLLTLNHSINSLVYGIHSGVACAMPPCVLKSLELLLYSH